jgi:2-furoate---CoA ligase
MFDLGRTILASAARCPHALAIVEGQRRLSYAAWLDEILRVVALLDQIGVKKGERLISVLQNRLEAATIHWACQVAGIVITPLNWRANAAELQYVLEDAEATALVYEPLSAEAVAGAARAARLPRLSLDGADGGTIDWQTIASFAPAPPRSRAHAEDLSLMLYTSGTTGRGKGVPRRHRAERAAALAHVAQNQYARGERTLGVMPLYHTMGVRSLLAMALIDGTFVCQRRFIADEALALIEREGITNLYLVPTLYHDLLASPRFARTDVSSIRKLGFAGQAMTHGLLKRLDAAFKPELFVNHFGSSEIYTFTIEPHAARKPGSAGKAGLNQEIRVVRLDTTNPEACVSTGEEGHIIASLDGDEAFDGYWRRPDADAKALHAGWYFTGDVGHLDEDGDLFVTGRVDDMIISGGENILPAEIEGVLSLHQAVAEVAVVGLPHERWGKQVTAFIKRSKPASEAELDAWCLASSLAPFKRPRAYVFVREIPKSPVGKLLRRKLVDGEYTLE